MSYRDFDYGAMHKRRDIVIGGKRFKSIKQALEAAVAAGYTGTRSNFEYRLRRGIRDFSELIKPSDLAHVEAGKASGSARKAKCQSARDEMAAMMAGLDARKMALQAPEEE